MSGVRVTVQQARQKIRDARIFLAAWRVTKDAEWRAGAVAALADARLLLALADHEASL